MLPNRMNEVVRTLIATVAASALTIGVLTVTTTSTGTLSVGSGSTITEHLRATQTLNPNSLTQGDGTSTVVTLTGAAAGDHCSVGVTAGDLAGTTSTAVLSCKASTNAATVFIKNASSSAFDAGGSTISVQSWAY